MRLTVSNALVAVILSAAAVACTANDHGTAAAATAAPSAAASSTAPTPVRNAGPPVTGTVAETMDAAGYTYARLTTAQGDQWAAIPQAQIKVGDTVTIQNPMMVDGFQSPTLKRTFEHILFGTLAGAPPLGGQPPSNPHPGMMPGAGATPTIASGAPVSRAVGPDAHTVAQVVQGKDALADKTVTVHARVVKYNGGIMGKNWVHVQDGSGTGPSDGDILVTTTDTAAVGDVVTVKGVVHTNRDFGSGYSYPVMIEDAKVTK